MSSIITESNNSVCKYSGAHDSRRMSDICVNKGIKNENNLIEWPLDKNQLIGSIMDHKKVVKVFKIDKIKFKLSLYKCSTINLGCDKHIKPMGYFLCVI